MNISPKERFLDICHFKRRGDLFTRDGFGYKGQTLEMWVERGAPREIINFDFRRDYFQFQYKYSLSEDGVFEPFSFLEAGYSGNHGEAASSSSSSSRPVWRHDCNRGQHPASSEVNARRSIGG